MSGLFSADLGWIKPFILYVLCLCLRQSHSEDPPYLTVGTEVSAKYRGAFCEATIKVAKKLVKCKVSGGEAFLHVPNPFFQVSYGKGQSALLSHDQISGHLKVMQVGRSSWPMCLTL